MSSACKILSAEPKVSKEIWKDIPGYEGRYQVSSEGRVRSVDRELPIGHGFTRQKRGRVLCPGRFCKSGHLSVILGRGTAGKPVHQLVALAFLGPKPEGCEVLHADGDPTNNRVDNLRYGTRTENILDVYHQGGRWRKLSTDEVHSIRKELAKGATGASLARQFGVSQTCISSIKLGRTFSWLT